MSFTDLPRACARMVLPAWFRAVARCVKVLEVDYNHFQSVRQRKCVARDGSPLPWYTYPAIEYLKQLDLSEKAVFEYGGGNSTLFWASKAKSVVCVEADRDWANYIRRTNRANVIVRHVEARAGYVQEIGEYQHGFDVVVVDGSHSRYECAQAAIAKLNPGGLIILDNADHYLRTAKLLRSADLIQVDMTGFGPIQGATWTTSLFFHRAFRMQSVGNIQPHPGIGHAPTSEAERRLHEDSCAAAV